jgi:hypothetical protein
MVFFEGAPHWSEVVVPAISILTVIGIIPFASSVARQIWVGVQVWVWVWCVWVWVCVCSWCVCGCGCLCVWGCVFVWVCG